MLLHFHHHSTTTLLPRLHREITLSPTSTRLAEQRTTPVCYHVFTSTSITTSLKTSTSHRYSPSTHPHNHFFYHLLKTSSSHRYSHSTHPQPLLLPSAPDLLISSYSHPNHPHNHIHSQSPSPHSSTSPQSVTTPVLLSSILTFHSSLDHIHYSSSNIHTHTTSTIAITST